MRAPAAIMAFGLTLLATPRALADTVLAEVTINGHSTATVAPFESGPNGLTIEPERLEAFGIRTPPGVAGADGRAALSAIPGVSYSFRPEDQAVDLQVAPEAMKVRAIGAEQPFVPPDKAAWGGLLNYSLYGVETDDGDGSWSASWEARLFGPPGVLTSSWFIRDNGGPVRGGIDGKVRRLDTTFVHDDPRNMRQWLAGDFITASQAWSRPLRGAGFSVRTDFSLRPDLVTAPMPRLRGAPSAPSTVDVYINGLKQLSRDAPGPFEIQQPPVFTGYGQVTMVVTDVLGRQSVQTFDFYGSERLLRRGLASWAAEAGWLRQDYSGPLDRYTDPFGQVLVRYGLNDSVTLEGRAAFADDLVEAGGGAVFKIREAVIVSTGLNLTSGRRGDGGLWRVGAERRSGRWSLYGAMSRTFGDYDDLARRAGDPPVDLSIQAGGGYATRGWGAFNLNYTRQKTGRFDYGVFNFSWTRPIGRGADLYITAYASERGVEADGVSIGFIMPLGGRGVAGGRVGTSSGGGTTASAYAWRPPPLDGGLGWRTRAEVGETERLEAEVKIDTRIGEAAAGVEVSDDRVAVRGYASGALVWLAGGNPRLADSLGQSFVMVDTGQPDVEILHENRLIGRTGRDGRLLIPYVAPFAPTRIGVAPTALDMTLQADRQEAFARTPRGAAVVLSLPVRQARPLNLRLVGADGKPLPVGSRVSLDGAIAAVVGYDGLTWISDAGGKHELAVELPDGVCRVPAPSAAGTPGAVTEVTCHAP